MRIGLEHNDLKEGDVIDPSSMKRLEDRRLISWGGGMSEHRAERLGELIKEELGELLRELKDPGSDLLHYQGYCLQGYESCQDLREHSRR